jgi:hypothetical protein
MARLIVDAQPKDHPLPTFFSNYTLKKIRLNFENRHGITNDIHRYIKLIKFESPLKKVHFVTRNSLLSTCHGSGFADQNLRADVASVAGRLQPSYRKRHLHSTNDPREVSLDELRAAAHRSSWPSQFWEALRCSSSEHTLYTVSPDAISRTAFYRVRAFARSSPALARGVRRWPAKDRF